MQNLESLIKDDFYEKHKPEFLKSLKDLIQDPSCRIPSRNWNLENLLKQSIGFNFKKEEIDLSISSILIDGIYLHYCLYPDLKENCILLSRNLISKKYILPSMVLERTDSDFVRGVGVAEVQGFEKRYIRANTAYLYTQSKFNLLREESQGFSKLLVLLSDNNIPSFESLWYPQTSSCKPKKIQELREIRENIVKQQAEKVLDQILKLIGMFELDSNRVLDLILDVFAAKVLYNYDFFMHLLRISPWSNKSLNLFAHFMGFKYSSYYSETENASKPPLQLVFVTALLIKENLMTLGDIYPHLYPKEQQTEENFKEYLVYCKELGAKAARYQGPGLSGVLGDDSSKVVQVEESKEKVFDKIDFKADLVECLLALGDLGNARKLLARSPNMSSMYPGIAEATCRLLHVIINPVYQSLKPLPGRKFDSDLYPPSLPTLSFRTSERPCTGKKISNAKYSFFYYKWADNLVSASDYNGAVKILRVILSIVGGHLSKDVNLGYKIIRIGKAHVESAEHNPQVMLSWLNIISQHIFPAVSLTYSNPGLACELWSFLKKFPYETRYGLYGEWKSILYGKIPEMSTALIGCEKDTKYIMARLSKETIKQYGRHIGKTVHSNPTISFAYIIKQLESYDNMIVHVVDASRYLTDLELDILTFSLIDALSDRRKKRTEQNGTSMAPWLKSLSNFCGTLFRRHSLDLGGVLRYIYNQLAVDNPYDLLVLQEMISSMSGIRIAEDVTNEQIEAIGAGETLRRESLMFESARISAKSTKRLLESLISSGLTAPIGILIANMKRDVIFTSETNQLKVIGWLHDHCKRTFLQYFDFLSSNLTQEQYSQLFPSFKELYTSTMLDFGTIFHMLRPSLNFLFAKTEKAKLESEDSMDIDIPIATEKYSEHPIIQTVKTEIVDLLPAETWINIKVDFFVTFWQLALYDISVPKTRYQLEIEKQLAIISKVDGNKSEMSTAAVTKRKRDKERAVSLINSFEEELKAQESNYKKVLQRIDAEKENWFKNVFGDQASLEFIQELLFPRCIISPYDATFCAQFCFLMHSIKVPRFSILSALQNLFKSGIIQSIIFSLTENESKNFGYFLSPILRQLTLYHNNEKEFEKFKVNLGQDLLDHEGFGHQMLTWEKNLRKSFLYSLHSGEYMQTRNSILVLDKINDYFPITKKSGKKIESMIKLLEKKETRGDLKQLSRAYYGKLQLRKKEWTDGLEEDDKSMPLEKPDENLEAPNPAHKQIDPVKKNGEIETASDQDLKMNDNVNTTSKVHDVDDQDLKMDDKVKIDNVAFDNSHNISSLKNGKDDDALTPVENNLMENIQKEQDKEEGEQNEDEDFNQNDLKSEEVLESGMLTEAETVQTTLEEIEDVLVSREDGEADPESIGATVDFKGLDESEPETSKDAYNISEIPNSDEIQSHDDQALDKMEALRKVLRERVEASRRGQDKNDKASKEELPNNESPSKMARGRDSTFEKQRNESNDHRTSRSIRDRDNQHEYGRDRSPKDYRESQKYNKDSQKSLYSKNYPDRDGERGDSERKEKSTKYKDYPSREYDRGSRYPKDYQDREREPDRRDRRDYRDRSPNRPQFYQKDTWTNKQGSLAQKSFKDAISGAVLENLKKETSQSQSKSDEGRRYDSKEPQMKRDIYIPPTTKEDTSSSKKQDDLTSHRSKDEYRSRRDRDSDRGRVSARVSPRDSPQKDRDRENERMIRDSKKSSSLERSWSRDKRRVDQRHNSFGRSKDVYTPQNSFESKSRNHDEYRDKRLQSSFEKERNNDRGTFKQSDSKSETRPRINENSEALAQKKRGLEEGPLVSSATSISIDDKTSHSRAESDKSSKKVKINRNLRDYD